LQSIDRVSARCVTANGDDDDDDVTLRVTLPYQASRGEWKKVAEVLDRLFFFLFLALLIIPTTTILGIVRLFKPDLNVDNQ